MDLDKIAQYITSKPSKIQIAKDDKWEEVWTINLEKSLPTTVELNSYLQTSPLKYISVELLFEQSDGVYIFGMDYRGKLKVKTPLEFLELFTLSVIKYRNLKTFITEFDQGLFEKPYFFHEEPDVVRIGVVNHWLSVGLCNVWKKGWSKNLSLKELRKRLRKNRQLFKTDLNYQCMSAVVNLKGDIPGACHWIKSPCGRKDGNHWLLDEEKIKYYLKEWSGLTFS